MKLFLNRRPCIGDVKRAYAERGSPGGAAPNQEQCVVLAYN